MQEVCPAFRGLCISVLTAPTKINVAANKHTHTHAQQRYLILICAGGSEAPHPCGRVDDLQEQGLRRQRVARGTPGFLLKPPACRERVPRPWVCAVVCCDDTGRFLFFLFLHGCKSRGGQLLAKKSAPIGTEPRQPARRATFITWPLLHPHTSRPPPQPCLPRNVLRVFAAPFSRPMPRFVPCVIMACYLLSKRAEFPLTSCRSP